MANCAKGLESEREASMKEIEHEGDDLDRLCQAVSPTDEPCDYPATVHCAKCGRWFCDAHAEDEEWHSCMLQPGDEGGEA
jgi:hypothetical protein